MDEKYEFCCQRLCSKEKVKRGRNVATHKHRKVEICLNVVDMAALIQCYIFVNLPNVDYGWGIHSVPFLSFYFDRYETKIDPPYITLFGRVEVFSRWQTTSMLLNVFVLQRPVDRPMP